jgi:thiopurine S-methyltransferase
MFAATAGLAKGGQMCFDEPTMDPTFWHARWQDGQIGFHLDRPNPMLLRHAAALPATGTRVLVPLCGKSLDLRWLHERGHAVLGVELSPIAAKSFFEEQSLPVSVERDGVFERYRGRTAAIEILVGDFFAVDAARTAGVTGYYDRAALVALPPELRARYVAHLATLLPAGARGLVVSFEYVPNTGGPPFSVDQAEVQRLYSPHFTFDLLERKDILLEEPKLAARGLTALHECAYAVKRR